MVCEISLPSARRDEAESHALIYFVCGNPGLIEYYADFFDFLRALLSSSEGATAYDLYGRNLLGFSDDDHAPFGRGNEPWGLEGQIEAIYADVASRTLEVGDGGRRPYDWVVLMGHSVGAYISVEIFHRHAKLAGSRAAHLNLRHGFLLFPTLTHIGLSPSGRKLTSLMRISLFETHAHVVAKLALYCIPEGVLRWITASVMGFSPQTAAVTARWLKSRDGVWQALHMGKSEMRTIREEKWGEELWEAAGGVDAQTPRFFMFYAREDHWVASHIRDAFIERRRAHGPSGAPTKIVVDEGDIKHAFCTQESESLLGIVLLDAALADKLVDASWAIARRVAGWVDEIEQQQSPAPSRG